MQTRRWPDGRVAPSRTEGDGRGEDGVEQQGEGGGQGEAVQQAR